MSACIDVSNILVPFTYRFSNPINQKLQLLFSEKPLLTQLFTQKEKEELF
jgi:hypothetical protein